MKITVFTCSQPRHITLIEKLADIADTVYACMEVTTLFPGKVADFFKKSDIMKQYFSHVMAAEKKEFGQSRFLPANTRILPMKMGDLNFLSLDALHDALNADIFIVFGASYIRSPLIEALINKKAINIHMGVSPYYRGSSCNFWALYDGRPEFVGATIHLLSKGLDSGDMLCHVLPFQKEKESLDGFELGMRAVNCAFDKLVDLIENKVILSIPTIMQDKKKAMRYTRNADFTDVVAKAYLEKPVTKECIKNTLSNRDETAFLLL